jgi:hypothetical protein
VETNPCPVCGMRWGELYAGTLPCRETFAGTATAAHYASQELKKQGCLWLNDHKGRFEHESK